MASNLGPIRVSLTLNTSNFVSSLKTAKKAITDFKRSATAIKVPAPKIAVADFNKKIRSLEARAKSFASAASDAFTNIPKPDIKLKRLIRQLERATIAARSLGSALRKAVAFNPKALGSLASRITAIERKFSRFTAGANRAARATTTVARRASSASGVLGKFSINLGGIIGRLSQFGKRLSFIARAFTSLKIIAGAALSVFGASQLLKFSADVDDTTESFRNLSASIGVDANVALERLSKAVRGTADNLSLMRQFNNAVLLGVADNIEAFEKLADAGRRLGKATGRTAAEGFADLAIGIGRQSRLILDNLGIIVRAEEAYKDFAEANNKAVDSLTDSERRQAFQIAALKAIEVSLEKVGDETLTFGDRFRQVTTSLKNGAITLSRLLIPSLNRLFDALKELQGDNVLDALRGSLGRFIEKIADVVTQRGQTIIDFIGKFVKEVEFFFAAVGAISRTAGERLRIRLGFEGQDAFLEEVRTRAEREIVGLGKIFAGLGDLVVVSLVRALKSTPAIIEFAFNVGKAIALGTKDGLVRLLSDLATSFSGVGLFGSRAEETFNSIARSLLGGDAALRDFRNSLKQTEEEGKELQEGFDRALNTIGEGFKELLESGLGDLDKLGKELSDKREEIFKKLPTDTTIQTDITEVRRDFEAITQFFKDTEEGAIKSELELRNLQNRVNRLKAALQSANLPEILENQIADVSEPVAELRSRLENLGPFNPLKEQFTELLSSIQKRLDEDLPDTKEKFDEVLGNVLRDVGFTTNAIAEIRNFNSVLSKALDDLLLGIADIDPSLGGGLKEFLSKFRSLVEDSTKDGILSFEEFQERTRGLLEDLEVDISDEAVLGNLGQRLDDETSSIVERIRNNLRGILVNLEPARIDEDFLQTFDDRLGLALSSLGGKLKEGLDSLADIVTSLDPTIPREEFLADFRSRLVNELVAAEGDVNQLLRGIETLFERVRPLQGEENILLGLRKQVEEDVAAIKEAVTEGLEDLFENLSAPDAEPLVPKIQQAFLNEFRAADEDVIEGLIRLEDRFNDLDPINAENLTGGFRQKLVEEIVETVRAAGEGIEDIDAKLREFKESLINLGDNRIEDVLLKLERDLGVGFELSVSTVQRAINALEGEVVDVDPIVRAFKKVEDLFVNFGPFESPKEAAEAFRGALQGELIKAEGDTQAVLDNIENILADIGFEFDEKKLVRRFNEELLAELLSSKSDIAGAITGLFEDLPDIDPKIVLGQALIKIAQELSEGTQDIRQARSEVGEILTDFIDQLETIGEMEIADVLKPFRDAFQRGLDPTKDFVTRGLDDLLGIVERFDPTDLFSFSGSLVERFGQNINEIRSSLELFTSVFEGGADDVQEAKDKIIAQSSELIDVFLAVGDVPGADFFREFRDKFKRGAEITSEEVEKAIDLLKTKLKFEESIDFDIAADAFKERVVRSFAALREELLDIRENILTGAVDVGQAQVQIAQRSSDLATLLDSIGDFEGGRVFGQFRDEFASGINNTAEEIVRGIDRIQSAASRFEPVDLSQFRKSFRANILSGFNEIKQQLGGISSAVELGQIDVAQAQEEVFDVAASFTGLLLAIGDVEGVEFLREFRENFKKGVDLTEADIQAAIQRLQATAEGFQPVDLDQFSESFQKGIVASFQSITQRVGSLETELELGSLSVNQAGQRIISVFDELVVSLKSLGDFEGANVLARFREGLGDGLGLTERQIQEAIEVLSNAANNFEPISLENFEEQFRTNIVAGFSRLKESLFSLQDDIAGGVGDIGATQNEVFDVVADFASLLLALGQVEGSDVLKEFREKFKSGVNLTVIDIQKAIAAIEEAGERFTPIDPRSFEQSFRANIVGGFQGIRDELLGLEDQIQDETVATTAAQARLFDVATQFIAVLSAIGDFEGADVLKEFRTQFRSGVDLTIEEVNQLLGDLKTKVNIFEPINLDDIARNFETNVALSIAKLKQEIFSVEDEISRGVIDTSKAQSRILEVATGFGRILETIGDVEGGEALANFRDSFTSESQLTEAELAKNIDDLVKVIEGIGPVDIGEFKTSFQDGILKIMADTTLGVEEALGQVEDLVSSITLKVGDSELLEEFERKILAEIETKKVTIQEALRNLIAEQGPITTPEGQASALLLRVAAADLLVKRQVAEQKRRQQQVREITEQIAAEVDAVVKAESKIAARLADSRKELELRSQVSRGAISEEEAELRKLRFELEKVLQLTPLLFPDSADEEKRLGEVLSKFPALSELIDPGVRSVQDLIDKINQFIAVTREIEALEGLEKIESAADNVRRSILGIRSGIEEDLRQKEVGELQFNLGKARTQLNTLIREFAGEFGAGAAANLLSDLKDVIPEIQRLTADLFIVDLSDEVDSAIAESRKRIRESRERETLSDSERGIAEAGRRFEALLSTLAETRTFLAAQGGSEGLIAKVDENTKALEAQTALEIRRAEEERDQLTGDRFAEPFATALQRAGDSIFDAVKFGEDIGKAIANALEESLRDSFDDLVKKIGDSLGDIFSNLGLGEGQAGFASNLAQLGLGITGAVLGRQRDRGSEFEEANVEDIVTRSASVRGVVAGPTNVPIAEVGESIRESFRVTEDILRQILDTLQGIETGEGLTAGGFGSTGGATT